MSLLSLLGVLIGTIMGLTGAGGVMAVPALVMTMRWSMQQAAPVAMIAVTIAAVIGMVQGLRKKQARYRASLLMVLFALPMTPFGYLVASYTPQSVLMVIFSAIMLVVAWRLFKQTSVKEDIVTQKVLCRINPESGRFIWSRSSVTFFAGIGMFTGFLAGLLGVGGGFLIVPLFRRYTDASMHAIVATSLMFIALVGSISVISAIYQGAQLPLYPTIIFSVTTIIGVMVGQKLSSYLAAKSVQWLFSIMLSFTAILLAIKAFI